MATSARELANRLVSILTVCRAIGMEVPETADFGRPSKTYCPFGPIYHSDRGMEAAFRVYPESNDAYCFAGCGFYTPTWLYAQANGLAVEEAAAVLLEMIGYKGDDFERRWEAVTAPTPQVSTSELAEALKVYCSTLDPGWEARQFDPATAALLGRCLGLLPKVVTSDDATRWLETTKTVMTRHLKEG